MVLLEVQDHGITLDDVYIALWTQLQPTATAVAGRVHRAVTACPPAGDLSNVTHGDSPP